MSVSETEKPVLKNIDGRLSLVSGDTAVYGDLAKNIKRLTHANLSHELLIKAVKVKNADASLSVLDATAGLGEDSLLMAAAGLTVDLCEKNTTVFSLLEDSLKRASEDPGLSDAVSRMRAVNADSIDLMRTGEKRHDIVYLDPMFPKREKSALVKKKFQILHGLEAPCENEAELLNAALTYAKIRVVVKRPSKGPFLAGVKPNYTVQGRTVRYDCYLPVNDKNSV